MKTALFILAVALVLLAAIALLSRLDWFIANDPDDDADHRMDSQRLGLPEVDAERRAGRL